MDEIISKDELTGLMSIKGKVRGIAIKSHGNFIIKEKGKEGLDKLEKAMASLGYPLNHNSISSWEFYPISMELLELIVIKKIFNFEDQKFEEIGIFSSRFSFIVKIFFRYFSSISKLAQKAPEMWEKYYTVGKLEIKTLDENKKYMIITVNDFFLNPLHCLHLKGYFLGVIKMVVGNKVNCEEITCPHRGGKYHEFLIKWE